MSVIISRLSDISECYDAVLCDLWGCVHDGLRAFPEAVAALQTFRARGGTVLMLTNAPRPCADVARQLEKLGVPRHTWDFIATSGDSARAALLRGVVGERVYFIGEDRDRTFLAPMGLVENAVKIRQVALTEAEGIVCTSPFDAHADPKVNRPDFLYARTRGLKLLCANPDILVDRGDTREWCAGALARLYTEMGGESLYFGKPHPPIYDLARRKLARCGKLVPDTRILAIGDGIHTDIQGGLGEGIDTLFVTGGLARAETATDSRPDPKALGRFLAERQIEPTCSIGFLR
ncbi:MAG: TIGR01459 family HAD-type hydrolase [Rhodobacteraceae bacterium]|nr:TIGR01459 family HAD-type hydrolase [Paracoccaceae bacterium]